jgi:murein L,D-transpeptidase YafK
MRFRIILKFVTIVILGVIIVYYFYPEPTLPIGVKIDKLIVYKSKRELLAYSGENLIKTYNISLGRQPFGHKQFEGDRKTPEGTYYIHDKNPNSGWHKNLGISYPNKDDKKYANNMGKEPGGDIKIHGLLNHAGFVGKFHRWYDWTLGCIALTDDEIDELYAAVEVGTPIEIYP